MANEPERPIEKLLRAAAQKRRDDAGPPFELHPADRRLLQGEVARKFAQPQRQNRSFALLLGQLWPRLAGGVAILAVLALAVRARLPLPRSDKSEALLARNQSVSKDRLAHEPPPMPAPAPTALPPSPELAAKSQPAFVASAETTPPPRLDAALQRSMAASPAGEGSAAAQLRSRDVEKLARTPAPTPADRLESATTLLADGHGTPTAAQTVVANGALERQYGLAGQPAPPASQPTAPAAPPIVAMKSATASVLLADQSLKRAGAPSPQPAATPVAPAEAPAQLAFDKPGQPSTDYRPSATVASANRPNPSPLVNYALSKPAPEAPQEAKALTVAQRFVQIPRDSKAKNSLSESAAPAHAVLASFQVEQAGQVLRIVDGDGSVYTGSLQPANAARRARSTKAEAPAATYGARSPARELDQVTASRLDSDALAQQNYAFRVTGTNRSLQKQVVFTGNLLTATNLTLSLPGATNFRVGGPLGRADRQDAFPYRATNFATGGALGGPPNATAQPVFLPLLNSRISGKVVVGSGKPTDINALPAVP